MTLECDVLVVGAGPAGSSAALAAAEAGVKTILIERKKEIGVPVQCAEAIGQYLFPLLPFKIPREQLIWRINGIIFWADDINVRRAGKLWRGYAIDRKNFDKWLASYAIGAGAKLFTNAELISLEFKDVYDVEEAIVKTPGRNMIIMPKVMIAADGAESTILKLLGFRIDDKVGEVLGFEMKNLSINEPDFERIFIDDFAPGGYAYIFPRSNHTANIGVGALFRKKNMEDYYEEFLEVPEVKRLIKGGVIVEEKSGKVPIFYATDRWVYGNVLLAGDAANQNLKPFVEGILPSIIGGYVAGKVASNHVKTGISIDTYPRMVMKILGNFFTVSDAITDIIYDISRLRGKKEEHLVKLGIMAGIFDLKFMDRLMNGKIDDSVLEREIKRWTNSVIRSYITTTFENIYLSLLPLLYKPKCRKVFNGSG